MKYKQIKIGAIISYCSLIVNIVIGLIYTPWMVNTIGSSQYGIFTLANSLISFLVIDFGLSAATGRYVSNYHAEGSQEKVDSVLGIIYRLYILIDICFFILFFFLFIFLEKIYVSLTPEELIQFRVVYLIAATYSIISFPFLTLNGILTAYEKFIQLKLSELLYRVISVLLIVVALKCGLGLYALVVINSTVGILIIIYKIIVIRHSGSFHINLRIKNKELVKEVFEFSFWITIMNFSQRLIFTISPSILGVVADSTQIAIFGIVSTIEGYVYSISTAINGMFMPRISRAYATNKNDLVREVTPLLERVGRYNYAVNAIVVVSFLLVGKDFIFLWMGELYKPAYYGIIMVILPGLFYNPMQIANTTILVQNKVKYQAIITVIIGVTNVCISFLLSNRYGAVGASFSIFIAYSIRTVLYYCFYKNNMKFDMKSFSINCYIRMLPCVVIPLIIGVIANQLFTGISWLYLVVKSVVIVISFGLSLLLCIDKDEIIRLIK